MFRTVSILSCFFMLNISFAFYDSQFMPENDLKIPIGMYLNKGLSQNDFNQVIDRAIDIYRPLIMKKGGYLEIERNWDDDTVNAYAQRIGPIWQVAMFGGLARHPKVTIDGFALVVCHEIGHHVGGAPKTPLFLGLNNWASNEGQSDYFGSLKCLRRVFKNDNNQEIMESREVPTFVIQKCSENFSEAEDQAICERSAMAGYSLADLLNELGGGASVDFETPDDSVVSQTNQAHPQAQCRLDTYFQGALCDISYTVDVSDYDYRVGSCTRNGSDESGLRPLCWFKP